MKVKFNLTVVMILTGSCLPACGPVLYSTVGQNVPLFKEKGEVALSLNAGTAFSGDVIFGESADGFNGQFALATGERTAVMASMYWHASSGDWDGNGKYVELGVGRFKNLKGNGVGEVFIGTGFGSLTANSDGDEVSLQFVKPFIQPSIGLSSKIVELAFTPRIALIHYTKMTNNLSDPSNWQILEDFYQEKRTSLAIEPGVTLRVGYKNVKGQLQWNVTTFQYTHEEYHPVLKSYFSIGLFVRVSERWNDQ